MNIIHLYYALSSCFNAYEKRLNISYVEWLVDEKHWEKYWIDGNPPEKKKTPMDNLCALDFNVCRYEKQKKNQTK